MVAVVKEKNGDYSLVVSGFHFLTLYELAGLDVTVPKAIREYELSRDALVPIFSEQVDDLFDSIRKVVDARFPNDNVA